MTNNEQKSTPATAATACATDAKQDNTATVKTGAEKAEMLNAEIKKTWNKLSDEDVKLYTGQEEQFFTKLKEVQGISKEDAQKRLTEIKASCGSCSTEKAA